jgi:hypothetical protein
LRHDFRERHFNRREALLDLRQAIVRSVCGFGLACVDPTHQRGFSDSSAM